MGSSAQLLLSERGEKTFHQIGPGTVRGTELAKAYAGPIRLKLFKIGAVILKNTRRIRFLLASGCPYQRP